MSDGKPKRRWTECKTCGLPMYSTLDTCEDCRTGKRAARMEYRRARRHQWASRNMRTWQQRREAKS